MNDAWEGQPTEPEVVLTVAQATALREALEEYMKLDVGGRSRPLDYGTYHRLWNAADIALVPLRGGPFSNENRAHVAPAAPPAWSQGAEGQDDHAAD